MTGKKAFFPGVSTIDSRWCYIFGGSFSNIDPQHCSGFGAGCSTLACTAWTAENSIAKYHTTPSSIKCKSNTILLVGDAVGRFWAFVRASFGYLPRRNHHHQHHHHWDTSPETPFEVKVITKDERLVGLTGHLLKGRVRSFVPLRLFDWKLIWQIAFISTLIDGTVGVIGGQHVAYGRVFV